MLQLKKTTFFVCGMNYLHLLSMLLFRSCWLSVFFWSSKTACWTIKHTTIWSKVYHCETGAL